jgi:hypothetical protein
MRIIVTLRASPNVRPQLKDTLLLCDGDHFQVLGRAQSMQVCDMVKQGPGISMTL